VEDITAVAKYVYWAMGQPCFVPGFSIIYTRLQTKQLGIFIIIMSNLTISVYMEVTKCVV
jgi:hypothetical protein